MESQYLLFNRENKLISSLDSIQLFSKYDDLELTPNLKKSIKLRIDSKKDFEITIAEMKEIIFSLTKQVEQLLKHSDFNPFKEELRKRFPEQYGSMPFIYDGITYYLYTKGREFYIDSLIYTNQLFKKQLEEHILIEKPLKYIYKKV